MFINCQIFMNHHFSLSVTAMLQLFHTSVYIKGRKYTYFKANKIAQ